jgi:hypothetical protein
MEINDLGMELAAFPAPAWPQGRTTVDLVVVQKRQRAKTQRGQPQPRTP